MKPAATLLFLLVAGLPLSSRADSPGWAFLKIGIPARIAAMADASVAVLADPAAVLQNPAAICGLRNKEWSATYIDWFEGIRSQSLSVAIGSGRSAFAASATLHSADGIERRIQASEQPLGSFGIYDLRMDLSYARRFGQLNVGGTARMVSEKILEESAIGWASDLGIVYTALPVNVGCSVRNLGQTGTMLTRSDALPADLLAGVSYTKETCPVSLTAAVRIARSSDASEDDPAAGRPDTLRRREVPGDRWRIGASYGADFRFGMDYRVHKRLALRSGYAMGSDGRTLSLGLGIPLDKLSVDYAFIPFDSGLGPVQRVTLNLR